MWYTGAMKKLRITSAIAAATLAVGLATPVAASAASSPISTVWTEPAAGYGFLYAAVTSAHHSIDLSMYELKDPTMVQDLGAAAKRGVAVTVILNRAYFGTSENSPAASALRLEHVHVVWAPSGQIFHAKYMLVDNTRAYIGSGNLVAYDYPSTRDFWVLDTNPSDLQALTRTFGNDVKGIGATVTSGGLVWSPGSTPIISNLIASAHHSLLVENEEMYSYDIENALVAARHRGVAVTVVMTRDSKYYTDLSYLATAGVKVRLLSRSQLYIHAKVLCVDCVASHGTALVSSINFTTSSLSYNRELGVVTTSPAVVAAVRTAVVTDAATGVAYH